MVYADDLRWFAGEGASNESWVGFSAIFDQYVALENGAFGYFAKFSGTNHVKFGHFVNFSYIFSGKNVVPPLS